MRREHQRTQFGVNVKKRLIDLHMTQQELSEAVGCPPKYLVDILSGRRSGAKYRGAICMALNLPYTAEMIDRGA